MSETKRVSVDLGYGLPTILFVVFMILKLTGHIGWSWLWVTAPLWMPAALVMVIIVAVILFGTVSCLVGKVKGNGR